MLWLDRNVGAPVCLLLTAFRRIFDWRGPGAPGSGPGKILFIKLTEQGSTVLASTAIRTAVGRVGRENVFFLAFEENRFVVDVLGLIPEANVLEVRTRTAWSMAWSAAACLARIRALRIDACVNLEFFARSAAAISYLTGASRRAGFHTFFGEAPYVGDLLTHRVLYNPQLHTSQAFTSLVRALDADPRRLPTLGLVVEAAVEAPAFRPLPDERAAVEGLLADLGVPRGSRLVVLNPNAGDLLPLRRWEGRKYAELARRLLAEFPGLYVVLTGSTEEAPASGALVREVGSDRCVSLAGRTTLRQLLVLYGLAEVLVTNDSGPAHFAALTEIDVVSLFGPETPLLFAAKGPRSHPLWAGIACSPCVNAYNNRQTPCRDNVCMKLITVDQVFELACRIYRARTVART